MDFRQLEYLIALYERKSFASAAEKVHVTHGALIHFLNKLENEIGAAIFIRSNSGLTPTAVGEQYIAMAKEMLEVYNKYIKKISDDYAASIYELTYAALPQFVDYSHAFISDLIKLQFPNTIIHPHFYTNNDLILDDVVNGTVDIGVTFTNCHERIKSLSNILSFENYVEEHFIFITPKDMPLPAGIDPAAHDVIDIHLFDDAMFYNPVFGDCNNKLYDIIGAPPHITNVPTGSTGYRHVNLGHGVAITMPSCVHPDSINWFRIEPKIFYRNYTVYRKNSILTKAERAFIKLREQIFYEQIAWSGQGR